MAPRGTSRTVLPRTQSATIRTLPAPSVEVIDSIGFHFGNLDPEILNRMEEGTNVRVAVRIDTKLRAVLVRLAPSPKPGGLSEYANRSITHHIRDLEKLLPAAMALDNKVSTSRPAVLVISMESASVLKAAIEASRIRGFTKVKIGRLVVACMYLHALESGALG